MMEQLTFKRSIRRAAELIYTTCRHRGWMPCGIELNAVRRAARKASSAVLSKDIINIIAAEIGSLEARRLPLIISKGQNDQTNL